MILTISCDGQNDMNANKEKLLQTGKESGRIENNMKVGLWRFYDSNGKLVEAKFYERDTVVKVIETEEAQFDTLSVPELGVRLLYPHLWERIDPAGAYLSLRKDCDLEFCTNLVLTIIADSSKLGQEYYANYYYKYIISKFQSIEILYTGKQEYNNINTYVIDYKFQDQGIVLGGTIAIAKTTSDKYLVFNFMGYNGLEGSYYFERLFLEEMLNSLQKVSE